MSGPANGSSVSGNSTNGSSTTVPSGTGRQSSRTLGLREFHPFEASGEHFLYMVPSAGVFHVDTSSWEVLKTLEGQPMSADELTVALADRYRAHEVADAIQ